MRGWRQYRNVDIDLHRRLTILTGANGAGKTTLLNILSNHFGWYPSFIGTPARKRIGGQLKYISDLWDSRFLTDQERGTVDRLIEFLEVQNNVKPNFDPIESFPAPDEQLREVGSITYWNDYSVQIKVPANTSATYGVTLSPNQLQVAGLYIPSHRLLYSYQNIDSIPIQPRSRSDAFNQYTELIRQRFLNNGYGRSPNYYIKETLLGLAMFGHGNAVVESNHESLVMFNEFQDILSKVLPTTLGFERIAIRVPEVLLLTKSGEFSLDAVSGGVASIIDMAWQIFTYSQERDFVVIIDEPENHLHPELQRSVLANMLNAFPRIQFVVASHNPFIVGSVPDSNVFVLDYDADNRVSSTFLDTANKAGTSNEILRDVLGLDFTLPIWVEKRLDSIVEEFSGKDLTSENFNELRQQMRDIGLEKFVPDTIARILKESFSE